MPEIIALWGYPYPIHELLYLHHDANTDRMLGKNSRYGTLSNAVPVHRPLVAFLPYACKIFMTHYYIHLKLETVEPRLVERRLAPPILNPSSPKPVARNAPY